MRLAVRDFLPQTRRAEIAVIFFAGHGIEIGGAIGIGGGAVG